MRIGLLLTQKISRMNSDVILNDSTFDDPNPRKTKTRNTGTFINWLPMKKLKAAIRQLMTAFFYLIATSTKSKKTLLNIQPAHSCVSLKNHVMSKIFLSLKKQFI